MANAFRFVVLLTICDVAWSLRFSCKNEKGEDVDWFYAYKLPELGSPGERTPGLKLLYIDSKNSEGWKPLQRDVSESGQPVFHTLAQLYQNKDSKDVMHMMYNDEHPDGNTSFVQAHAKGVLAFARGGGFWLIHSVPKFPPAESYVYPHSGHLFGQSFLCVSLAYDQLKGLGPQFFQIWPSIYSASLPKPMDVENPILASVMRGKHNKKVPNAATLNVTSTGGTQFVHFAKANKWNQDLYSKLVAPSLNVSLSTETWMNGPGNLTSSCTSPQQVRNILELKLPGVPPFADHHDHAKWAVSESREPWICVGDINRQITQFRRGGGTLCQKSSKVWKAYSDAVTKLESCPTNSVRDKISA